MKTPRSGPAGLVLFDGDCGFCRRSIGWLRRQLRPGVELAFCPYQSADISPQLRAACQEAVHVLAPDGTLYRAGRAVVYCLLLSRWRRLGLLLRWGPPLWLLERLYAFVASHRSFISRFIFVHETAAVD